jgi:hypothetical protein
MDSDIGRRSRVPPVEALLGDAAMHYLKDEALKAP